LINVEKRTRGTCAGSNLDAVIGDSNVDCAGGVHGVTYEPRAKSAATAAEKIDDEHSLPRQVSLFCDEKSNRLPSLSQLREKPRVYVT
jgi:hypothetical protein